MPLVTILAQDVRWKVFDQAWKLKMFRGGARHHIGARNAIEIFRTRQHHTTQESGGVWFFIAATPKHHDRKSIVRNAGPHMKGNSAFLGETLLYLS